MPSESVRDTNRQALLRNYLDQALKLEGLPHRLMIEPANICDLRCPLCPTGNGTLERAKGLLSFDNFLRAVKPLQHVLDEIIFWNYGEPFLNPVLGTMFRYARDCGIRTSCSTNGLPLHQKYPIGIAALLDQPPDTLIISIDGATNESHAQYRVGSRLDRLLVGLEHLLAERSRRALVAPTVELQFIVMKHNEHELNEIRRIAAQIGVDKLSIKSVNLGMALVPQSHSEVSTVRDKQRELGKTYLPLASKLSRYVPQDASVPKHAPTAGCVRPWSMIVVNRGGEISPCCYDINAAMSLGNAFTEDIADLWNSHSYQDLRRRLLDGRKNIPLCSTCTDGSPINLQRTQ